MQGFFVATLGYDKGSCQFSDFTNGTHLEPLGFRVHSLASANLGCRTCQQGNVCNLQAVG